MRRRVKHLRRRWEELRLNRASAGWARRHRADFEAVATYCMFLGYPRSGHSLFGALIDAHPNAIISHELNSLRYLQAGFSRDQIFALILNNSQTFAQAGREWTGYNYSVPNQWQGKFTALQVIGDKKGGATSVRLHQDPELLRRLQDTVGVPIRFIHVIRNPYDNISTMFRRNQRSLQENMARYFYLCQGVLAVTRKLPEDAVLDVRHEDFLQDPKTHLHQICSFLGLEAPDAYLEDCAGIVYTSPHRSRTKVDWDPDMVAEVQRNMVQIPFLEGYSFES
jgi:hypothetical protein